MNSTRDRRIMWMIKLFLGGCLLAGLLFPDILGSRGRGGRNAASVIRFPR